MDEGILNKGEKNVLHNIGSAHINQLRICGVKRRGRGETTTPKPSEDF